MVADLKVVAIFTIFELNGMVGSYPIVCLGPGFLGPYFFRMEDRPENDLEN